MRSGFLYDFLGSSWHSFFAPFCFPTYVASSFECRFFMLKEVRVSPYVNLLLCRVILPVIAFRTLPSVMFILFLALICVSEPSDPPLNTFPGEF